MGNQLGENLSVFFFDDSDPSEKHGQADQTYEHCDGRNKLLV